MLMIWKSCALLRYDAYKSYSEDVTAIFLVSSWCSGHGCKVRPFTVTAQDTYTLLQGFPELSFQAKAHVEFRVVGICEIDECRLASWTHNANLWWHGGYIETKTNIKQLQHSIQTRSSTLVLQHISAHFRSAAYTCPTWHKHYSN